MTNEEINQHNQKVYQNRIDRARNLLLEATKYDAGQDKPSMGLVPQLALQEVAKVLDFGAKKYSAHNWRLGMDYSRLYDAVLRHMSSYIAGEDNDKESGLSHIAHAACGTLMLLEYILTETGKDDRYKK